MGEVAHGARGVHAVIVTFAPDATRLARALAALEGAVASVILIDNASPEWDPKSLHGTGSTLTVERLSRNVGIAAAQNRGIELARERKASQILLLDQDSVPQAGMVGALLDSLKRLTQDGHRIACVGSRHRLSEGDGLSTFDTFGWLGPRRGVCGDAASLVECDTLISSGTLIPMDVIDDVGVMDEGLFIDLVDTEWCFRAKSKGYRVFGACGAVLDHRLGESERRVWAGRWRRVPRHKASRYYYIFRNTVLLSRREHVPLKWVLYYLRWMAVLFLVHGALGRGRQGEISMMLKGFAHGVRGVSGRIDGG